jgi:nicotinamidase-related amidase
MKRISPAERGRSCLLVIDPQEKLMPAIHEADKVIKQTALMMRCASILDVPVLATTQYAKGLGPFVPELAELHTRNDYIDKTEFNCFANRAFRERLKSMERQTDTFIITGVEAHICIFQTALGAMEAGFRTWIVTDAVSSRDPGHADEAMELLRQAGAATGPAEMIIYQLLEKAGTQEFRSVLQHIK